MHFSQVPSAVNSQLEAPAERGDSGLLRIELQGFIDTAILGEQLASVEAQLECRAPTDVLCDMRAITGYGSGTSTIARAWLADARRRGVRRVALIATSSVLRTAVALIASRVGIELRCFLGETEARRWLDGPPPPAKLEN